MRSALCRTRAESGSNSGKPDTLIHGAGISLSDDTHHAPVTLTALIPAFHCLNFLHIDLIGIAVPEAECQRG